MKGRGNQKDFARKLRQQLTDAERTLWARLRNRQLQGVRFRRQQPIGSYIVDFICLERQLIIEVDGGQHNERKGREEDRERTKWLQAKGYRVLRFWNNDVLMNTEGVLERITQVLSHPHPGSGSGVGPVKYRAEQDFTGQALASPFIEGEGFKGNSRLS